MLPKLLSIFLLIVCCGSTRNLQAQGKQNFMDSLLGTWKGTSLCQVKNSPCHDEIVVYHITKGRTADSCDILANKIVNGVEEEMGTLPFKIQVEDHLILSSAFNGNWEFKMTKTKLEGTVYVRGSLYRIIRLTKIE